MDKKDLVSIVITTYNRVHILPTAIDSVLGQTYSNIELVIVDDCSQDNTPQVVDGYLAKDERIIYVRNEKNQGCASSRNIGINNSHGDFLMFLDSDCEYLPQKIEQELSLMYSLTPFASIIYSNMWIEKRDSQTLLSFKIRDKLLTLEDIFSYRYLLLEPSSWFCKSQVVKRLGGFDSSYSNYEDMDFLMRAILSAERLYFLNRPLSIKHNLEGVSSVSPRFISQKERFLNKFLPQIKIYKKYTSRFYYRLAKDLLKLGDFKKSSDYFWNAFLCQPFRIEYFLRSFLVSLRQQADKSINQ